MNYRIHSNIFLLLITAISIFSSFALLNPKPAAAAADPGYRQIFDNQICTSLKDIKGQKLSSLCRDYIKQSDMDKAKEKICKTYKVKLKSECQAYDDYKKGSFTPAKGSDGG